MLPGMGQPLRQGVPPALRGARPSALPGGLLGDVEVHQHVRLSDTLPHSAHVRVLLKNLASVVPALLQGLDEKRLARGARPDNSDQLVSYRSVWIHHDNPVPMAEVTQDVFMTETSQTRQDFASSGLACGSYGGAKQLSRSCFSSLSFTRVDIDKKQYYKMK